MMQLPSRLHRFICQPGGGCPEDVIHALQKSRHPLLSGKTQATNGGHAPQTSFPRYGLRWLGCWIRDEQRSPRIVSMVIAMTIVFEISLNEWE